MSKESRIIVASESEVSVRSFNDIPDAINSCIEADGLISSISAAGWRVSYFRNASTMECE
jgi:hypothetical protein